MLLVGINRSGKVTPAKKPKIADCQKCRFKCNSNFDEDQRQVLCRALGDDKQQTIHLSSLIQNVPVKNMKVSAVKHKTTSRIYKLKNNKGERVRVCQKFFCATLALSHRVTDCLMTKVSDSGLYSDYDRRMDSKPANATPSDNIKLVKEHIDMFPRVESHYCRKDTTKMYLSAELNISKLYDLYKNNFCQEKNIQPVSQFVYRKVFNSYNPQLSFYIPKKDQCTQCSVYHSAHDKSSLEEEWQAHKNREKASMSMKQEDKDRCQSENGETFRAISFDLQALLSVPYSNDSQLYYRRKLNVYNFTIFDCHNNDGYCFVWDECNGRKGSSEIGTCILRYLRQLPPSVSHVSSFSDTCGGQNRNKYVVAAMLFAVNKIESIETIDLKYMESGHSYLEADSMHATIERARKNKKIYTTREWALLMSTARKKSYNVETLVHSDFHDLKELCDTMLLNVTLNTDKEKVNWLKVKWLRFEKNDPYIIKYKYDLNGTFMEINIHQKRNSGRKKLWAGVSLASKYPQCLPVTREKKADLEWMMQQKIIPDDYRHFYSGITSSNRQLDDE